MEEKKGHKVIFTRKEGKVDLNTGIFEFNVELKNKKIGKLTVREGSMSWSSHNRDEGAKIPWETFRDIMDNAKDA